MPTNTTSAVAQMDRASRLLPTIGEEIAYAVQTLTGAPMDVIVIAWTNPRASWGGTCSREDVIVAIDALIDRWKHPDDPSYGRVEFGKASEPVKRLAVAGGVLMHAMAHVFGLHFDDPPAWSLIVLADSGPSYFGKAHRSQIAPELERLSAYMKATTEADDTPAHDYRGQ